MNVKVHLHDFASRRFAQEFTVAAQTYPDVLTPLGNPLQSNAAQHKQRSPMVSAGSGNGSYLHVLNL